MVSRGEFLELFWPLRVALSLLWPGESAAVETRQNFLWSLAMPLNPSLFLRPTLQRNQLLFARWIQFSILLGAVGCTSTPMVHSELQDGTFARVSYDRERDESDLTLRLLDDSSNEVSLGRSAHRDFYLSKQMLSGLRDKAEVARARLKNKRSADRDSLRILAVEALVNGQPELVQGYLGELKSFGKKRKRDIEDQLLIALSAGMTGDRTKARTILLEIVSEPRVASAARANLGLLAMRFGSTREALEFFRQAEALEPKNTKFTHMVGEAAYSARRFSVALEAYKRLVDQNPDDLLAQFNLGLVYLYGTRHFSAAKSQFRMVLDHPKVSRELRIQADGAYAIVLNEEDGSYGLASAGER